MIPISLADIYHRIRSQKSIVVEVLDYNQDGCVIPRKIENFMSLQVAAELSVKLLESSYPDDMSLLYLLGCLPAGISEDQLHYLWSKYDAN